MKHYRIIGWYSTDPTDPDVLPFPRVILVEARDRREAYDLGYSQLERLYEESNSHAEFLNWYIKEVNDVAAR